MAEKRLSAVLFLLLAGCAGSPPAPAVKGPLTILAVGESTTALGGNESWPAQLERMLQADCPGAKVKSWAVPGGDSAEAAARLPAGLSIHKPQAVIAMLGINDYEGVTPGQPGDDLSGRDEFPKGRFTEERELEEALFQWQLGPRGWSDRRFVYLFARPYRDSGRVEEELKLVREIVGKHPWNPFALAELGTLLRLKGKLSDAEALHRRAFESEPNQVHLLQEWLADFTAEREFEAAYQEALKLTKNHRPAHFVAASFYQARNLRQKHENVMRRIVNEGCSNRKCLLMLQVALVRNGKTKEAEAVQLPPFPEPIEATKENLEQVAIEVRQANKAALFWMQYPLMPPEHLENLKLMAAIRPVAIIPNDQNFRAALERQPYDALFADRFAGDFGHFKPAAARLVAESALARVLPWAREKGYCR